MDINLTISYWAITLALLLMLYVIVNIVDDIINKRKKSRDYCNNNKATSISDETL